MVCVSFDAMLPLFMLSLGVLCSDIEIYSSGIRLASSVNGIIAIGKIYGNVAILSPSEPKVPKHFQWHTNPVISLAFSDDGCVLYSGAYSRDFQAHDTTTWECIFFCTVNSRGETPRFIVASGDEIAVGCEQSSVVILNASNGVAISEMTKIRECTNAACLIPGEIDVIRQFRNSFGI